MSPPRRDQALLQLVAPILASPADDDAWSAAFTALLNAVPIRIGALLQMPSGRLQSSDAVAAFVGIQASQVAAYREAVRVSSSERNCATMQTLRQSAGFLPTEHLPGLELAGTSRLSSEIVRAHENGLRGIAAVRDLSDGGQLHFALLRPDGHSFDDREREVCDGFLFIVVHLIEQRVLIRRLERERIIGRSLAENAGDAVFVLDANRRIEFQNSAAHNWLEHAAVVVLQAERLQFQNAADSRWLRDEVAALLPHDARNGGDSLRYRRIQSNGSDAGIFAVLSRLPILPATGWSPIEPRVALYLRCVEDALPQLSQKHLADLFGLTATESRVVNALLIGITVEQMAQQWSIRSDTVRSHLKRILVKTNCSRQQELIQVITKAMPYLILMNDPAD